ncbi:hypothetical protein KO561_17045 [Radiobacillus kanasensis]|uniref:hypothetical protein n=1 Tax=Radiobacillus kanasensis TaxID=2844358 RepID=UPI001E58DE09|nr:hypothetical protein [Radiobacillus kanasensis]UFT98879.1 hypothetical protein KO561_17045 [Radiobacillus kanasensis]
MVKKKSTTLLITIIFFYFVSYGITLFNDSVFWDDVGVVGMDSETILEWHNMAGMPYIGWLIVALSNLGAVGYRILSFFVFLLCSVFVYLILNNHKELFNKWDRFYIVAIFSVFPVFTERLLVIIGWYTIPYLLFFLGWYLLTEYYRKKQKIYRILSLLVFFLSFAHNSLLFFYGIVLIDIIYYEREKLTNIKTYLKLLYKYLDFLIIPIVARFIQTQFDSYGLYKGYNEITIDSLFKGIGYSIHSLNDSFLNVIIQVATPMNGIYMYGVVWIITIVISLIILKKHNDEQTNKSVLLFIYGILTIFAAVFPYCAVGKIPQHIGMYGRWQLLIPLGASITIYYGIKLIASIIRINIKVQTLILTYLITGFSFLNLSFFLEYQLDHYKQLALIYEMKNNKNVANNNTFIVVDNATELNAKNRTYKFYEFNYILKQAYGNPDKLAIRPEDTINKFKDFKEFHNYHFYEYEFEERPEYMISIDARQTNYSHLDILKLLYYEKFDQKKFNSKIQNLLELHVKKL